MGSCCSCPDKDTVPDNHRNKFKVVNVDDDDGNELGSGFMELTDTELILYTRKRDSVKWHYLCLRRYGYDSNLFSFESGRLCQTGQGIFVFKCARAEELFNMLQEIMQNYSIDVVEEPVVERSSHQTELEVPRTPRTPTTPGLGAQKLPNGHPCYPSFGDTSSHPSSRHSLVGSAHKIDYSRHRDCTPTVFNLDIRHPSLEHRQLNYIQVDLERGGDSDNHQTPKTTTTPLLQTPTRLTELYTVIDIERTVAVSNLQKALPRDDGTSRKTRHNSTDLPM